MYTKYDDNIVEEVLLLPLIDHSVTDTVFIRILNFGLQSISKYKSNFFTKFYSIILRRN